MHHTSAAAADTDNLLAPSFQNCHRMRQVALDPCKGTACWPPHGQVLLGFKTMVLCALCDESTSIILQTLQTFTLYQTPHT